MTAPRGGAPDPMQAGAQMWEAGYRALLDGWQQAQEYWTGVARSFGEMTGAMAGQWPVLPGLPPENAAVLRELQEATLAVSQAWLRLPVALMTGAQPSELQDAITRLTEAQGRAFQMWTEAISRIGGGKS